MISAWASPFKKSSNIIYYLHCFQCGGPTNKYINKSEQVNLPTSRYYLNFVNNLRFWIIVNLIFSTTCTIRDRYVLDNVNILKKMFKCFQE